MTLSVKYYGHLLLKMNLSNFDLAGFLFVSIFSSNHYRTSSVPNALRYDERRVREPRTRGESLKIKFFSSHWFPLEKPVFRRKKLRQ